MADGRIPILVGPTAVGKTAVAVALAAHLPVEVVSADSRQIYRHLDIGTAKPSRRERAKVPHHGLDLLDPGHRYNAGRFALEATEWIEQIRARGNLPIVVGGTGLYIRALTDGLFREPSLDPSRRHLLAEFADTLNPADLVRWASRLDPGFAGGGKQRAARAIEVAVLSGYPLTHWQRVAKVAGGVVPWFVRLTLPRQVLHHRILHRAQEMVRRGLIEEVASVLAEGHGAHAPGLDGVGIREAVEYLHGERTRESVADAVSLSSRQYAKRQETWFRHQLHGPVLTLDATRPPELIAVEIAQAWERSRAAPAAD